MDRFSIDRQEAQAYAIFPADRRRPVIGITANYGDQTAKLAEGYYKQVADAGGTPLIIPPMADKATLLDALDRIDGLLLSGGADVNPLFAGEQPVPQLGGINDERDLPELLLARLAYNRQMPILGICRGIQTIAMALGGTVTQHIGATTTSGRPAIKHSQEAARHVATHTVELTAGSTLFDIYNEKVLPVNSFHHQAVNEPGPHLRVAATSPDGIVEAVESTEMKPLIGVQWHPECMGEEGRPLYCWLLNEARAYRETQRLHDRLLTLDTHCDTPMFFAQGIDFGSRDSRILVDLPKMHEGRLDATIMVAYLPQDGWSRNGSEWRVEGKHLAPTPLQYADGVFCQIKNIVASHRDHLALARTPADLWRNKREGKKSILMGIENGLALEGKVENVAHFARQGIVYITLCHNGDNDICDSARGTQTHGGVSPLGEQVIGEMNRLGLMVDLSHAHEKSFYDALDISRTPIVCSHSSARALCDHPRNLTDEQMKALARKGGVCQITLYHGFLAKEPKEATIADAMAHLEHAIRVMGIDHVGLGTDFDGDGGIRGLASAAELTNFTKQLLRRRYSEEDIQKIWGGNFLRVMEAVQTQMA